MVLSRRAWLEQTQSETRHNFPNTLQKAGAREGVVSSIVNFGAFVDLWRRGRPGARPELSWKHTDHPSEVVEVGDKVTVEVLDVDMDRERVSLSPQGHPGRPLAALRPHQRDRPGRARQGHQRLVPFGAFVRVDDGIEGLVHISELAERHVEIPEQVVQVNDGITSRSSTSTWSAAASR